MATLRRGLPRTPGGEPWPPAGTAPALDGVTATEPGADAAAAVAQSAAVAGAVGAEASVSGASVAAAPVAEAAGSDAAGAPVARDAAGALGTPDATGAPVNSDAAGAPVAPDAAGALGTPDATGAPAASPGAMRRGLPRVAGGEPWPPSDAAPAVPVAAAPAGQQTPAALATATTAAPTAATPAPADATPTPAAAAASAPAAGTATPASPFAAAAGTAARRGLPRTPDGEPWPPAGTVLATAAAPTPEHISAAPAEPVTTPEASATPQAAPTPVPARRDVSTPLPVPRTVTPGKYAFVHPVPSEPVKIGRFTRGGWAALVILGGAALIVLAFLAVTFTRWILSLDGPADFIRTYPGEYELPEGSVPGFPAWAQWQHFFNVFLMVLIIRSGWLVRTERRPDAFFTARWAKDQKKKISLTLWLHQALDVLWVVNGIIFVVLLFASGHWVRVVPTSWEVFPNALSAVLQYISLDWPTEHGWVNYNSIQQLMYFTVIFLAAPLAAITGVRMSGIWPKNATALNKAYPVEVARTIHFPVMLFFVIFIIIHVALVFATGALRNLNHMFGGTDLVNWTGFWIFVGAMAVIAAAMAASRTIVLAPIAKLFGQVSSR